MPSHITFLSIIAETVDTSKYRRFQLIGGLTLLVGKSAEQNEELSFRIAKPNNIWLHASGVPGSHGLIVCETDCPTKALRQAAQIVAFYSKAKGQENVPVVYCEAKYLTKPEGSNLGTVNVGQRNTIHVSAVMPMNEALKKQPDKKLTEVYIPQIDKFPYWTGPAFRADGGYTHSRNDTAADVVRYERDELGNDNNVPESLMAYLEEIPANQVLWVCQSKKLASRYKHLGPVQQLKLPQDTRIIGFDDEDGYLVLLPSST